MDTEIRRAKARERYQKERDMLRAIREEIRAHAATKVVHEKVCRWCGQHMKPHKMKWCSSKCQSASAMDRARQLRESK